MVRAHPGTQIHVLDKEERALETGNAAYNPYEMRALSFFKLKYIMKIENENIDLNKINQSMYNLNYNIALYKTTDGSLLPLFMYDSTITPQENIGKTCGKFAEENNLTFLMLLDLNKYMKYAQDLKPMTFSNSDTGEELNVIM